MGNKKITKAKPKTMLKEIKYKKCKSCHSTFLQIITPEIADPKLCQVCAEDQFFATCFKLLGELESKIDSSLIKGQKFSPEEIDGFIDLIRKM